MTKKNLEHYIKNFLEKTNTDDASYYLKDLYEQIIFEHLDSSIGITQKIHQKLIEQNHISLKSALQIDYDLYIYAPQTNLSTTECFVYANSKGNIFNTILNGPRNHAKDVEFLKKLNINVDNYKDPGWDGITKISIYSLSPDQDKHLQSYQRNATFDESIDHFKDDSYSNSICCKIRKSNNKIYKSYGHISAYNYDFIKDYFQAYYLTIKKLDLQKDLEKEIHDYREIGYERIKGVPVYEAIAEMTTYILQESNYQFDIKLQKNINLIEKYFIEKKLFKNIPVLNKIYDICQKEGYISNKTKLHFNDLDNSIYAHKVNDTIKVFYFTNQNREYTAILHLDNVENPIAFSLYTDIKIQTPIEYDQQLMNILNQGNSFAEIGDILLKENEAIMQNDLYLNIEQIRAWNSFLLDIETAIICLEDE